MLSARDFEKFAWPHMKEAFDKTVETDTTMFTLSEGTTKHITDFLADLPKGHFCFYCEADDIFERRKALPNVCLWGGLPADYVSGKTPQECIDYVKRVIDEVGTEGGVLISTSRFTTSPTDCKRENLLAVSEFVHNYTT